MKRWLATFLAVFLAVATVGQASLAAGMLCGPQQQSPAASSDAGAMVDEDTHRHCHKPAAAKDCSDVCKRLCGNTAFVPQTVADPAPIASSMRVQPSMAVPLLTRATPPDTPPPIA